MAYINAGVTFNILRCGQRHLVTDCHFIDNDTTTIFNTSFVATELIAEIDTLKRDNDELRNKVLTLAAHSNTDDLINTLSTDKLVIEGIASIENVLKQEEILGILQGSTQSELMNFSQGAKLIEECTKEQHCEN